MFSVCYNISIRSLDLCVDMPVCAMFESNSFYMTTCPCVVDVRNCLFTSFIAISTVYSRMSYLGCLTSAGPLKQMEGGRWRYQYRKILRDEGSILPLSFNVCVRARLCAVCVFACVCVRCVRMQCPALPLS